MLDGLWTFDNFPDSVLINGINYLKAVWACDICYADVIAQYREDKVYNAGHLFVYEDKTWSIDHIDKYNPDKGKKLEHVTNDILPHVLPYLGILTGVVVVHQVAKRYR